MFQGGQKQSTSSPRYSSVCTSFWTNSNTFVLHVSFVRATAQRLIENTTAIVREATLKNQQITLRARTNCTKSIHLFTKEKTSLALKEARWDLKEKLQQPVRTSYSRLDSGKGASEIKKTYLLLLALHAVLWKMPFFLPDYSCHVLFRASVPLQICFFPSRRPCIVFFGEAANLNFNRTNALKNWGKGGNKGKGISPILFILLKVKGPFASHPGGRNFWHKRKSFVPFT